MWTTIEFTHCTTNSASLRKNLKYFQLRVSSAERYLFVCTFIYFTGIYSFDHYLGILLKEYEILKELFWFVYLVEFWFAVYHLPCGKNEWNCLTMQRQKIQFKLKSVRLYINRWSKKEFKKYFSHHCLFRRN